MNEIEKAEVLKLILETESLKVEKNSRGYNWEYRLQGKVEENIKRIKKIEEELRKEIDSQNLL